MPMISVLMPVYNGEKYIEEAVRSVLSQDYTDFELVVIDDGSTDATSKIVHTLNDGRIVYKKNEKNLGLIDTLNLGVSICSGKYIARLDADDRMLPGRLFKQCRFLDEYPGIAIVGSNIRIIGTNRISRYPRTDTGCKLRLLEDSCFAHPAIMARAEVLKSNPYPKDFVHAEDYALWSIIAAEHSFHNIAEPLTEYRVHATQTSSVHSKIQQENRGRIMNMNITRFLSPAFSVDQIDFFQSLIHAQSLAKNQIRKANQLLSSARAGLDSKLYYGFKKIIEKKHDKPLNFRTIRTFIIRLIRSIFLRKKNKI